MKKDMYGGMCITESLCCTPETNQHCQLQINKKQLHHEASGHCSLCKKPKALLILPSHVVYTCPCAAPQALVCPGRCCNIQQVPYIRCALCASCCPLYFSRCCKIENVLFFVFVMYYLCEKYSKPVTVQYYIASCVSWLSRRTSLDL